MCSLDVEDTTALNAKFGNLIICVINKWKHILLEVLIVIFGSSFHFLSSRVSVNSYFSKVFALKLMTNGMFSSYDTIFFNIFIGVELLYNVVLVSAV